MVSSEVVTNSPRPKQAPRTAILTHNPGSLSNDVNHVLVADQVHPDALKRSCLLQGFGQTVGLAPLPASVSPEDFQLWQTACRFDVPPSTEELVKLLKVRRRQLIEVDVN